MKQVLTNIGEHEAHCDELVPLMKETLNAILTMTERIEIDDLFKNVSNEIDAAKQVLTDIRSVLRSDGPASARVVKMAYPGYAKIFEIFNQIIANFAILYGFRNIQKNKKILFISYFPNLTFK